MSNASRYTDALQAAAQIKPAFRVEQSSCSSGFAATVAPDGRMILELTLGEPVYCGLSPCDLKKFAQWIQDTFGECDPPLT